MEKTPLGNVIMYWNNSRGSFEFYSDNTIPYRYLETVGRKYVKTFNCRSIFFICSWGFYNTITIFIFRNTCCSFLLQKRNITNLYNFSNCFLVPK